MVVPLPIGAGAAPDDLILAGQDGGAVVRRSVLPGGVRVLTEADPTVRSATVGAWVGVGSRDEADDRLGSTHFLEHLLFKGTRERSAMDIAACFDEVGGEANAATAKEFTCYFARVRGSDVPLAIDVISDMVTSATLGEQDFATERGVILEELAMVEDDAAEVAHEAFGAAVLGRTPLGRPIGGTPESIRAATLTAVREHFAENYRPESLVVTAAGDLDHADVCARVEAALRRGGWDLDAETSPLPRREQESHEARVAEEFVEHVRLTRPAEQSHVIIGGSGLAAGDDRRYVLAVLTAIFGGGMSSRLFQTVREQRGLAYSVYCFASSYAETGLFGMYAACAPRNVRNVLELLAHELESLAEGGVDETELRRGIGQVTGSLVLGLEDTGSRMSRLGRVELVQGEFESLDEILRSIGAVTAEDVRKLAEDLAGRKRSTVVVGPSDDAADPEAGSDPDPDVDVEGEPQ